MLVEIGTVVGAGVIRSVAGWFENALEDGKIEAYEWAQLMSTVVRVAVLGLAAQFGLGMDEVAAAASAVGADFLISKLR